jgi:FkbM family methyltransferase
MVVLSVSLDNAVGRAIFYGSGRARYEPKISRLLAEELLPGDVFVDGGASFGWYTALATELVGESGAIYSIEANRMRARVLAHDIRRARVAGTCVVAAGLGAAPGRGQLRLPTAGSDEYQRTLAAVPGGSSTREYETEVITLDSLRLPRLDVLKLDIEGAEFDALLGARETLLQYEPKLLLIEAIDENLNRFGRTVEDLTALLASLGYAYEEVGGPEEAPMWACRPVDQHRS